MALESALSNLSTCLRGLHEVLDVLRLTVMEDVPKSGSVVLVDRVSEEIMELLGLIEESLDAAKKSQQAASQPYDPNLIRLSLVISQKRFQQLSHILSSRLLTYEPMSALLRFGRSRGPEWVGWVESLRQGLDKCHPAIESVDEAFFQCWQEIAERVAAGSVSVHATNIGQQITSGALKSQDAAQQGIP